LLVFDVVVVVVVGIEDEDDEIKDLFVGVVLSDEVAVVVVVDASNLPLLLLLTLELPTIMDD